ncbi:MAG: sulfurtransferase [Acidobacteria bacterium]|nr:sulfurtransferase [Acidobacteriota bacterium]
MRDPRRTCIYRYLSIITFILLPLGYALSVPASSPTSRSTASVSAHCQPALLVEAAWLSEHLKEPCLRIVDVRSETEYTKGHIPGAVRFDSGRLRTADKELMFLPAADDFAKAMGELGIDAEKQVVIYDGTGGNYAARLWWVLDHFGHQRTGLLNGGWTKWTADEKPVSTEVPAITKATFVPRGDRPTVCAAEYVVSRLKRPNVVIIDARSPAEFSGEDETAKRGGHVPGAVNIEWRQNLNPDLTFRSVADLKEMYTKAGVTEGKEIITYCHVGGRAAQALFTLRLIGLTGARNYYGAWSEWESREDTPVEKAPTP